ncbi:MAG: hypothetical protein L0312_24080 [Acidobacteria bacterium]|nr:hypothetical protein [Acidobacteriota bacterium]
MPPKKKREKRSSDLPLRYWPGLVEHDEKLPRPLRYGVGIQEKPGSFGMLHGPCERLQTCLDVYPDDDRACVVRFNTDGSDEVIYRWMGDYWERYPGVTGAKVG